MSYVVVIDVDDSAYIAPGLISDNKSILDIGAEFQAAFNVLGGKFGAIGKAAHVLHSIEIVQMAILIEMAGIAGVIPAPGKGLLSGLGVLVVAQYLRRSPSQYLAIIGDPHRGAGVYQSHGVNLYVAAGMLRNPYFGHPIELTQVHPYGCDQSEDVRPQCRPGSERNANLEQAELVPQRIEYQEPGQPMWYPPQPAQVLPTALGVGSPVCYGQTESERLSLEESGLRDLVLDGGSGHLPEPGGIHQDSSANFADVLLDCCLRLREAHLHTAVQAGQQTKPLLRRPSWQNEGDPLISLRNRIHRVEGSV